MEVLGLGIATVALLVGFGLLIGVLFGFFGMGGSFLVTPVLLVGGYPAPVAVGSGLAFVFGTSVVAALGHRTHGQIDYVLAAPMIVGLSLGIEVGKRVVFLLDDIGGADVAIGAAYVGLLAAVGLFVLRDARTNTSRCGDTRAGDTRTCDTWTDDTRTGDTRACDSPADDTRIGDSRAGPPSVVREVRALELPPILPLSGGGTVSVWVVLVASLGIGVLSGCLGVGGGFLLLPVTIYGFGIPTALAVGTSTLQIAVAGAFGTFVFAQLGAVDVPVVVALLGGSALGARVGAGATRLASDADFETYFAAVLLAGSVAVACEQVSAAYGIEALETLSGGLIFGAALLVCGAIVRAAIGGLEDPGEQDPSEVP